MAFWWAVLSAGGGDLFLGGIFRGRAAVLFLLRGPLYFPFGSTCEEGRYFSVQSVVSPVRFFQRSGESGVAFMFYGVLLWYVRRAFYVFEDRCGA